MSENIMSMANGVVHENPYFEENMKIRVPEVSVLSDWPTKIDSLSVRRTGKEFP